MAKKKARDEPKPSPYMSWDKDLLRWLAQVLQKNDPSKKFDQLCSKGEKEK